MTAIVKVCSDQGQFIIWKIHQAPYIEESDTCLLSEYQMQSKGTCVDSCSIHHKVRPGVKGTQCIWSHGQQQSLKINLTDLGGTMGVKMYPVLPGDNKNTQSMRSHLLLNGNLNVIKTVMNLHQNNLATGKSLKKSSIIHFFLSGSRS